MADDLNSVLTGLNGAGLYTLSLVKSYAQSQLCSCGGVGCGADGVEVGALCSENDLRQVADCHATVLRSFLHAFEGDIGDGVGVYGNLNGYGAAKALCDCRVGTGSVSSCGCFFCRSFFLSFSRCAASTQAEYHGESQEKCKQFLHLVYSFQHS